MNQYALVALVGGQYYGARATINVWNPETYQGEFSFAQIWVGSGEGDEANTMEVGWLVSWISQLNFKNSIKFESTISNMIIHHG